MASSPTPSLESLNGAAISIGSFGEANDYLSDSPLTLSGSSPPISDSAICDDFIGINNLTLNHHHQQLQQSQSQTSSIGSTTTTNNNFLSLDIYPRCTGCKNKQSDAVAKCIDCVNYLCSHCVTAHQFMHCFDGHNVYRINDLQQLQPQLNNLSSSANSTASSSSTSSSSSSTTATTSTTTLLNNKNSIMNDFDSNNGITPSIIGSNLTQQQRLLTHSLNIKDDLMTNTIMNNIDQLIITPPSSQSHLSSLSQQGLNQQNKSISPPISPPSSIISNGTTTGILSTTTTTTNGQIKSPFFCQRHKSELLKFYCRTCKLQVCKDCILTEHPSNMHECEHSNDTSYKNIENLQQLISNVRSKMTEMKSVIKNVDHASGRIQVQYHKAQNEINDTYQFYRSMLDERKQELMKDLENLYNTRTMVQTVLFTKSQESIEKMNSSCDLAEKMMKQMGLSDVLVMKKIMDAKLQSFVACTQELQTSFDLDFVSNFQSIQVGVRNTFGYIRAELPNKQPPIARPTATNSSTNLNSNSSTSSSTSSSSSPLTNGSSPSSCSNSTGSNSLNNLIINNCGGLNNGLGGNHYSNGSGLNGLSNGIINGCGNGLSNGSKSTSPPGSNNYDSQSNNIISKRFNNMNSLGPFINDINLHTNNPYEKWSNGGNDNNIFNNLLTEPYQNQTSQSQSQQQQLNNHNIINSEQQMIDLSSKLSSINGGNCLQSSTTTIFPPKSQIKRQKMIYHCKFGEFGVMEGQFTEPSGVAVNAQNDIIVADTNNHRIQIFDKEGRFKFQFGECGKRDGQLLYPNRVAVVRTSGDIIVTERSPTHQIQIYNQYGQFVRKFGANILQHPRGVTVDNKGRIIVVECKVMRVIIFDQSGNVLQKFGCSKHLEFPNGVVVNDKQEIFISDNRAHCVKVFNYEGVYLRQIGGEGITNYPIGVGINSSGEILIADNHNNFNLTIFTQDGQLVSALESKVKHAQCFDVALMDDGSVVLASKDYRLYIYRYVQVPTIGI